MTSYQRSIATMGLSRTVSEIDGDFRGKSTAISVENRKISPPPCILRPPPADGVPLGIGIGAGSRKNSDGTTGPRKKFGDIFSGVDTMHQRDGQIDGHRATEKTALTHSVAL